MCPPMYQGAVTSPFPSTGPSNSDVVVYTPLSGQGILFIDEDVSISTELLLLRGIATCRTCHVHVCEAHLGQARELDTQLTLYQPTGDQAPVLVKPNRWATLVAAVKGVFNLG